MKYVYGNIPKVFRFYLAAYPYILSPARMFELLTHVAWHGRLYYGWSNRLLNFIEMIPPSYALANPAGCQEDFDKMVEELFQQFINDEDFLSGYYERLFRDMDYNDELHDIEFLPRGEFVLHFNPEKA